MFNRTIHSERLKHYDDCASADIAYILSAGVCVANHTDICICITKI